MDARALTRDEKKKIRSLVTGMCANYDRETGDVYKRQQQKGRKARRQKA